MSFCDSVIPPFRDCKICLITFMFMVLISQNSGQGPITHGVMSLGRFSKFKMHFAKELLCLWSYFNETNTMVLLSEVRKV